MNMTIPTVIGASDLHDLLTRPMPPQLIDVRTAGEFATSHIAGSHNVPLDLLRTHRDEIGERLDGDVVLICRTGQRAIQAQSALRAVSRTNVQVLDGGLTAWEGGRLAVTRGAEHWDLERQVRLTAGSLVAAAVLGSIVTPKLKWLAGAVGGGLVYAALSNTCAMGQLLAKLPHNRGPAYDLASIVAALVDDAAV